MHIESISCFFVGESRYLKSDLNLFAKCVTKIFLRLLARPRELDFSVVLNLI
jgi:hypothetical protein